MPPSVMCITVILATCTMHSCIYNLCDARARAKQSNKTSVGGSVSSRGTHVAKLINNQCRVAESQSDQRL